MHLCACGCWIWFIWLLCYLVINFWLMHVNMNIWNDMLSWNLKMTDDACNCLSESECTRRYLLCWSGWWTQGFGILAKWAENSRYWLENWNWSTDILLSWLTGVRKLGPTDAPSSSPQNWNSYVGFWLLKSTEFGSLDPHSGYMLCYECICCIYSLLSGLSDD